MGKSTKKFGTKEQLKGIKLFLVLTYTAKQSEGQEKMSLYGLNKEQDKGPDRLTMVDATIC